MDLLKKLEDAQSLENCKIAIEQALEGYSQRERRSDNCEYCYESVLNANIKNKWKKSLIHALQNFGLNPNKWTIKEYLNNAFNSRDLKKVKLISKMFKQKLFSPSTYSCAEMAQEPKNNTWIIKYLTNCATTLSTKKAFLKGAIKVRNMSLIVYIVDVLKTDLFVPTHVRSVISLGYVLAEHDDLELVQWLEARGYNIHESRRQLLSSAYSYKAKRIAQYVLEKQQETAAFNIYMEKISNQAFYSNDDDMLRKFPVVDFHVSQIDIYNALVEKKDLLRIKILFDRYVVIQNNRCEKGIYFAKTPENTPVIFENHHINRFVKLANYGGVWTYISGILYKYGSTDARALLQSIGYVLGAASQTDPVVLKKQGQPRQNYNYDDDDDLKDMEDEAVTIQANSVYDEGDVDVDVDVDEEEES